MEPITVVIPVGPLEANKRWLQEALNSVHSQSIKVDEILMIDDMAGLPKNPYGATVWRSPWHLGVASAFNFGVALARNNLVFMLGSDDYLEPRCLEWCVRAWEREKKRDAYYYVTVEYLDDRPVEERTQTLPCNAAMVTRSLWRKTGGFPIEAFTAPDAAFLSQFWNRPDICPLIPVAETDPPTPLYYVRTHEGQDTASRQPWQGVILATRNLLTEQWKPPEWGRFE